MKNIVGLCFVLFVFVFDANAVSFTADAVQIRNGESNHARIFWTDDRVRFEYLDQGVAMVQIYDILNKKIVWLDTENKVYLSRELTAEQSSAEETDKRSDSENPCSLIEGAHCTRLKETVINQRDAVKWLITLSRNEVELHIFQWLDKEYGVVLKQENPDGSGLNVNIEEDQEVNGRLARKVDMYAMQSSTVLHSTQWFDNELGVVVRQVFSDGAVDELQNIKVQPLVSSLFSIPEGYDEIKTSLVGSQPDTNSVNERRNY